MTESVCEKVGGTHELMDCVGSSTVRSAVTRPSAYEGDWYEECPMN